MTRAAHLVLAWAVLVSLPALAVAATTPATTVTILSPEPGFTVTSDLVEVRASFAAAKGEAVARVELLVDGVVVHTSDLDPPQSAGSASFTWAAAGAAEGGHRLSVRATDTRGRATTESIRLLVRRARAGVAPIVGISSPVSGAAVSGATRVQVRLAQPELVKYVIYLVDDVFRAMTNVPPFSYLWDTTQYLNGIHRLQAKAYLASGAEMLSPVVEVRVDNPGGETLAVPAAVASPPAAPARPARAAEGELPPPVRTESPATPPDLVRPSQPEVAVPGTAPFVSPSGELVTPPRPAEAGQPAPTARIEIAELPDATVEITSSPAAAGPVLAAPPTPPAGAPAAAPTQPMAGPAVPPTTVVAPAPAPEPVVAVTPPIAPAAPRPEPTPKQVALLPPRPPEPTPAAKVAPPPVSALGSEYVVQPGDCLWSIAAAHKVPMATLAAINGLTDPTLIWPGQRLVVPASAIFCEGRPVVSEVAPMIVDGKAIIPLRAVVQSLGGTVNWDPVIRQASASLGNRRLAVTIGSSTAQVDGEATDMGTAARLQEARTLVPARFLGEALALALHYQQGVVHIARAE